MANFFDQFDAPSGGNFFDKFDAPAAAPSAPITAEGLAKAGGSGVVSGTAGLLNTPDMLRNLLGSGVSKGYELATGTKPTMQGPWYERLFASPEEINKGLKGTGLSSQGAIPTVVNAASDALGGNYQPKNIAEKFAKTTGEFLPGAAVAGGINPGNLLRFGVAPALASEGAGQAVQAIDAPRIQGIPDWVPSAESIARFAGAVAGPSILGGMERMITPNPASPEYAAQVKALQDQGVDLTAGQRVGKESMMRKEAQTGILNSEKQGEQFTQAALKKIGVDANRATPEVMAQAEQNIGQKFNDLGGRNTLTFDGQFNQDMMDALTKYGNNVAPAMRSPIIQKVGQDIYNAVKNGTVPGDAYQSLRSDLSRASYNSGDWQTSRALREMRDALDNNMERSIQATNPADAGAWKQVRQQYADYKKIENAMGGAGRMTAVGILSPSQLRGTIARGKGRAAYVKGNTGDLGDLARAGEAVMKPMSSSGTAENLRALLLGAGKHSGAGAIAGGAIGSALGFPLAGAAVGSALGPVVSGSRPVQAYLANQLLPRVTPTATGRALPALLQLINQGQQSQWPAPQ